MAGTIRKVRCELCKRFMFWVPGEGRYLPLEVQVFQHQNGTVKPLFYYECICGQACAWFIPACDGDPELLVKRHFRVPLDEVLP